MTLTTFKGTVERLAEPMDEEQLMGKPTALWKTALRRLFRRKTGIVGMILVGMMAFSAIFAPLLAPYDPQQVLIGIEKVKKREAPCIHMLGCDASSTTGNRSLSSVPSSDNCRPCHPGMKTSPLAWCSTNPLSSHHAKFTSPEEAAKIIKSGDKIVLSNLCSEPRLLPSLILDRAQGLSGVRFFHCRPMGRFVERYLEPGMEEHVKCATAFAGGVRPVIQLMREGRADFYPIPLSRLPWLFRSWRRSQRRAFPRP